MYKLCVFAGTTEGRELVEFLARQPVSVTACVATAYGQTLLPQGENLHIRTGRMDQQQMQAMLARERFDLVVDATHPYAQVVTENLAAACAETATEYLRLLREETQETGEGRYFPDIAAVVQYLNGTQGNILLTTGSKELAGFGELENFDSRVYARVLPMPDSLELCRRAGVQPAHIFAMQGPFSVEMNLAMLRSANIRYLVSKASGTAGGFDEKLEAAAQAQVQMLVIGRPPQRQGLSLSRTLEILCQRFSLVWKPLVSVVGIGSGSREGQTRQVQQALGQAQCLIGARRMLDSTANPGQRCLEAIAPQDIADCIHSHREVLRWAVVMSGDTGFFSGTKKLLPLLSDCQVQVLPGISSMSCLCARLGTSYEDVKPVSLHGRSRNLCADVAGNKRVFVLTGGENGAARLCAQLTQAGLGQVQVSAGEQLGYPDERIVTGTAAELAEQSFSSLCALLIENPAACQQVRFGLPDEAFGRCDGVPMTKSEVRSVCLSKLRLTRDALAWDIGAGSGSVALEMAMLASDGQVFAIERREDALAILEENRQRFHAENLKVVPGLAPDACRDLPAPTHAFLGGTGGQLRQILTVLLEKNPQVRIVASAISLESLAELTQCAREFAFAETEVVSLTVARAKKAGPYQLMLGQNPIYLFTMQGGKVPCTL